jgi:two-component system sensor histidine kinase EvgS
MTGDESWARRALVAEDDPVGQELLRRRMRQLGFRCDVVADGQAAVNALLHHAYDVILMDCQMPTVNGKEAALAIRLREIDGQQRRTPIIAVTAFGHDFSEAACRAAGMDAFLGKPVSMDELRATLERVLDEHPSTLTSATDGSMRAPPVSLGAPSRR